LHRSKTTLVTTGNGSFAVRQPGTAKGPKRTVTALPCVDARQRAHGSVANGNAFFAVRLATYARQKPLPCPRIVVVRISTLPCVKILPCAHTVAVG
jgi:hypothetical protein